MTVRSICKVPWWMRAKSMKLENREQADCLCSPTAAEASTAPSIHEVRATTPYLFRNDFAGEQIWFLAGAQPIVRTIQTFDVTDREGQNGQCSEHFSDAAATRNDMPAALEVGRGRSIIKGWMLKLWTCVHQRPLYTARSISDR